MAVATIWQRLTARVEALSLRERALVLIAALSVLIAGWYLLLMQPLAAREAQSRRAIAVLRARSASLEAAAQPLLRGQRIDPNARLRAEIRATHRALETVDRRLNQATVSLIDPRRMASVLETVLRRQRGLELISLKTLGVRPLLSTPAQDGAGVFRHELEIDIVGGYVPLVRYLQSLQREHWKLYWDRVELQVQKYPLSRIRLRVHTLSLRKGWLGV